MAQTFDPKQHVIIFGGIRLTDFVAGDYLTLSFVSDTWSHVTGADGSFARAKINDSRATATLSVLQTGGVNLLLSVMWNKDFHQKGGAPSKAFLMTDLNGRTVVSAGTSFILKPPDLTYGTEIKNRDWQFVLGDCKAVIGGSEDLSSTILGALPFP